MPDRMFQASCCAAILNGLTQLAFMLLIDGMVWGFLMTAREKALMKVGLEFIVDG